MDSVILEITTHELDKLLEMYPECLLRLPPREREVIEMRNSGFTLDEIGKHYNVTTDWESDDIDRDTDFEGAWVAELDEEGLVEDLLNTPQSKCLDDIVETMFEVEE